MFGRVMHFFLLKIAFERFMCWLLIELIRGSEEKETKREV